jgi:hypothetical protein
VSQPAANPLKAFYDRVLVYFAADFKPSVVSVSKLNNAAAAIQHMLGFPEWNLDNNGWRLRDPPNRRFFELNPSRLFFRSLGFDVWQDSIDRTAAATMAALSAMDIDTVRRYGFRTVSYVPVGMSHREISLLMFGTFVADEEKLGGLVDAPNDPVLQVEGKCKAGAVRLIVTSEKSENVAVSFLESGGLQHFTRNPLLDSQVRDFHERLKTADCLVVDADVGRQDAPVSVLTDFLKAATEEIGRITRNCVDTLKQLPVKRS